MLFPKNDNTLIGHIDNLQSQIDALLLNKQDKLTIDTSVIDGSFNPVSGGGVFSSLSDINNLLNELKNKVDNLSNPNMCGADTSALAAYGSGTVTYAGGIWTVVSPVTSSSWGCGARLNGTATSGPRIPFGYSYRASMEVKVPSAHTITIDCNNYAATGTSWNGNDNDDNSTRIGGNGTSGIIFSIPANTWTKISWGYANTSSLNTSQVHIYVQDGIGLNTANDSGSITWYIRNVKAELNQSVTSYTF